MIELIVRIPFGPYKAGDRISDPKLVQQFKASRFVVAVRANPPPPKKPDPAK